MKLALANALLGADFVDDVRLHEWFGYEHAGNLGELHEWLTVRWADWWRFTVVRDPIARFASLYREKIDPGGFGDIDTWIAGNADSWWWDDIHAQPQIRIIGNPADYDHVGRVESLAETATALASRAGQPIEFERHNATTPGSDLSERTRSLLARRYAADLETLGY